MKWVTGYLLIASLLAGFVLPGCAQPAPPSSPAGPESSSESAPPDETQPSQPPADSGETAAPSAPAADSRMNFRFLISDEANAITEFDYLNVVISSIGVHRSGEDGGWTELEPILDPDGDDEDGLDLTNLVGENALVIWSGTVDPGEYNHAFIYVYAVAGALAGAEDDETANVKLPGGKLHISKPFTIDDGSVANFVYDITVVRAGQSGQYVLRPQATESGTDQEFTEVGPDEGGKPKDERELDLEVLDGDIAAGESVTLHVTLDGTPLEGVRVWVSGTELDDRTTDEGTVVFTIPVDAVELEIEAKKGNLQGETTIDLTTV